ncbi:MAG: tandem-95 repeat protein, partial [Thiogranum sp.]|nr:tandem-95 repeat protein [Thiogranum sp.]
VTGADYAATTEALTLWFVPDSDWNGVTTFQYVAGDDGGAVDASPATATITVSSVNDTPTTTGIADVSVNEDTLVTFIDLKTKFDDVEDADASLVYTITNNTNPGLVSTSIGGSGGLNINYAADQSGTADITVRATDTGGLFVETSFTVTVNPVNDAPVAVDDAYNVVEGSGGFLPPAGVLLNDTDIDSGTLTAIQLSNVAHGNLTLNSSGSWWYTPDPDYNGTDSFTYKANDGSLDSNVATVTLNIAPRNDPPAGADSTVTTLEDTDYVFSSTDFGFSDPVEGDAFLAVRITTLPDAGTLTLTGSGAVAAGDFINTTDIDAGKLVFTPAADANGTGYASFSFQVQDDGGTSNGGVDLGPTANTMTIDVTPVADAPVITSNGGGDTGATSVVENTAYVTTVTATDADLPAETLTYSITGGPDAVDFSIDGSTGVLTFVNAPDYENPQGSLSGGWVYQVVVQVSDVSLSDTQTLDILVSNTNDPPIITSNGGGDTANVVVPENSAVVTTVTATDQDSGIQPLTYSISGGADAARFNIDSQTGALGLAAPPDYEVPTDNGSDNTYEVIVEVSDVNGATDAQTIHVSVDDVNEAPAANNDVILAGEDSGQTAVAPGLVSNDTDPEGNAGLYIYAVDGNTASVNSTITLASGALLTVNADGSTSYVSNGAFEYLGAGESAIDTFTYTIADAGGLTSTATVTVSIVGVNDAPVINGLSGSLNAVENSTAVTTVTANDADSDPLVYSVSGGTDAALFSINSATGELSFIAAPDFELPGDSDSNNVYEVEVSADDGNGGVDTLQISVEIADVNDNAPGIETGLTFAVPEDAANGVSPGAATATDVDTVGSLQNWQIVSGNGAGVFAINESTGEITVTDRSALDYENNSSYAIGLQVSDGINISSIETVTIDVININEAPSHTVPGTQTTSMNTSLAFSSLDGNGISISDPDASVVEVTLSVTNGNLTLSGTGGLTFSAGDGESDATMTFTGAADAVNAALDGLLFQPDMEFLGFANLTVITDDRGESGSGGPMTTMNTVTIAVLEVAGAPDILEAIPTLDALVHDFGEPHQLTIVSDMLAASPYRNELSSETTDTAPEAGAGSSGSTESPVVPDPGLNETMPGQAGTSLLRPYGQIQFSEPESDSDRSSASVLVQRAVRQALADPLLIAGTLVPEAPLWSVLDLMLAQMNSDDGVAQTREDVIVKSAQGLTFTLTAGYVSWLLRAGYLSASLLSIAPLWRQFDPLPILARPVKDKSKPAGNPQEQPGSDEITAEEVFMTSRNTA